MAIAGKVAPTYDGDWSADKSYQQHTYVRYNGDAYIAMKASVGIEPTNEEYWFLALKNVSQAQLDALNNRIDQIQTTSSGTLSEAGWYRVAKYVTNHEALAKGSAGNSCELFIKRQFGTSNTETHHLRLSSKFGIQTIETLSSDAYTHIITKARYVIEGITAYLEIYYAQNALNPCYFEITHPKDYVCQWQGITPVLTSETVDGVTVTTTYDIPANASPVTDLDLVRFDNTETLDTDILKKAETLKKTNGIYHYKLGGSSYVDESSLPHVNYAYSTDAVIMCRGNTAITVVIYGTNLSPIFNNYNGSTWSGWQTFATTADLATELAKYLLKTGGKLTGNLTIEREGTNDLSFKMINGLRDIQFVVGTTGVFYVYDNTNKKFVMQSFADGTTTANITTTGNLALDGGGTVSAANDTPIAINRTTDGSIFYGFKSKGETVGWLGFKDKKASVSAYVSDTARETFDILHTGNSSPIIVSTTAPSDTNAVWYDTVNKMLKRYVDGAWQQ